MAKQRQLQVLFFLILGGAALLRVYMVCLDMNVLLDQGLVQDDAFYYYMIAHNIITHGHSSFDNINLTNGFHPLWQAICLPIFYLWQGDTPVRIMLAIASSFDLLSICICFLILQKLARNSATALIGAMILAFHGTIIRTWFNGLETALSIFSLLWLLYAYLSINDKKSVSLREHGWFGFIAAVSFLARTDNAIILLAFFTFLYAPRFYHQREIKPGAVATAVFVALIAPWLIWNIDNFGSIVQISGKIRDNTWLVGGTPADLPFPQNIIFGAWVSLTPIRIVFEKMFAPSYIPSISGYLYFLIFTLPCVYLAKSDKFFKKQLSLLFAFIFGISLLFLYHAGVRHFVRGWYNAPVLLVLTLLLCLMFDSFITRLDSKKIMAWLSISILSGILILYSPYNYTRTPKSSHLDPRVAAAQWINHNTPLNSLIAAANAGIVGYYAERSVINLDGVVNENAFKARINDQLHRYIYESNIEYLADHKGSIVHLCKENDYFSCTQVNATGGGTLIMRVDKKSAGGSQ